jgi:hypothetical protein
MGIEMPNINPIEVELEGDCVGFGGLGVIEPELYIGTALPVVKSVLISLLIRPNYLLSPFATAIVLATLFVDNAEVSIVDPLFVIIYLKSFNCSCDDPAAKYRFALSIIHCTTWLLIETKLSKEIPKVREIKT